MPFNPQTAQAILEARGVSAEEVADAASISKGRLGEMLQGARLPSINQVQKLAEVLAVEPFAFYLKTFEDFDVSLMDFRGRDVRSFRPGLLAPKFKRIFELREMLREINHDFDVMLTSSDLE